MPKGFSVDNLLDAQAITLLRTLSALVSMLLLLCPLKLTTVAAVSCGSITAVYTARPLSVTLPGNAVFPCSSCRNKRHTNNKEQMKSTMCLLSKVMCVCVCVCAEEPQAVFSGCTSEGQSAAAMSVCELQGMSCVSFPNRSWGPHALKTVGLSHAAMMQCLRL